jgi:hypothetical protein
LKRIESHAFDGLSCAIILPRPVWFVASDLGISPNELLFAEGHSCEEFNWWLRVRKSGISVDFRRVFKFGSDLLEMRSYLLEDSVIKEAGMICESGQIVSGMYQRLEDSSLIVVKSIFCTDLIAERLIENTIEQMINLCHPCISAPIGFVLASGSRELKVLGLYSDSVSLAEVIGSRPAWWTPTAKAKAVAGLVLGLRFAHSLGLIHGHLTTNNILLDSNHRIQITDFLRDLSGKGICGFSNEEWIPDRDVRGFVSILFEIVVGRAANDEMDIPTDIPMFVSEIMRLSGRSSRLPSFVDIFETLKQHDFGIVVGVDSA